MQPKILSLFLFCLSKQIILFEKINFFFLTVFTSGIRPVFLQRVHMDYYYHVASTVSVCIGVIIHVTFSIAYNNETKSVFLFIFLIWYRLDINDYYHHESTAISQIKTNSTTTVTYNIIDITKIMTMTTSNDCRLIIKE